MHDAWSAYMNDDAHIQLFIDSLRRDRASGRMSEHEYRARMLGVFDRVFEQSATSSGQ